MSPPIIDARVCLAAALSAVAVGVITEGPLVCIARNREGLSSRRLKLVLIPSPYK